MSEWAENFKFHNFWRKQSELIIGVIGASSIEMLGFEGYKEAKNLNLINLLGSYYVSLIALKALEPKKDRTKYYLSFSSCSNIRENLSF